MIFWHFFKAWVVMRTAKWRKYEVIATPWVMLRRESLCQGCDFFEDGTCQKCGCLIVSKILLNTEKCPVGRWNRVWVKKRSVQKPPNPPLLT